MKSLKALFLIFSLSLLTQSRGALKGTQPTKLWSLSSEKATSASLRNRQLQTVGTKFFFQYDTQKGTSLEDGQDIVFEIPASNGVEEISCTIFKGNPVLSDVLLDKFPDFVLATGECQDEAKLFFTVDTSRAEGMSALFISKDNEHIYVDSVAPGTNEFVIYSYKDAKEQPPLDFRCENDKNSSFLDEIPSKEDDVVAGKNPSTTSNAYKFKIAMIATNTYSRYHGNTKQSVLFALATLMTRVNGVYSHEMGVYFELIDDTDAIICLDSLNDADCDALPNDSSIINDNQDFLEAKGISYSSYDLGHSVTTGSGGLARYPSLCSLSGKAAATTGLPIPEGDPFAVDYVCHEIGHQVLGAHAFRDCRGEADTNLMLEGAVEPGSGSTIMSYAGICSSNNIATSSDPYFNNLNLQQMRDYIESVARNGSCGTVYPLPQRKPTVSSLSSCTVLTGTSFQLSPIGDNGEAMKYSWDRVDAGFEDIDNPQIGRFRSWKPDTSKARFFPNLNFLTYPSLNSQQRVEQVPLISRTMTFRVTARRLFDASAEAEELNLGQVGDFAYSDTLVTFDGSPMTITNKNDLQFVSPYQSATVRWDVGGSKPLSSTLKAYIAINTLVEVTSIGNFDSEVHIKELDWKFVAEFQNTGSATFELPNIVPDQELNVNIMIRSQRDGCFFFDMIEGVTLAAAPLRESSDDTGINLSQNTIYALAASASILVIAPVMGCLLYKTLSVSTFVPPVLTPSAMLIDSNHPTPNALDPLDGIASKNVMYQGEI